MTGARSGIRISTFLYIYVYIYIKGLGFRVERLGYPGMGVICLGGGYTGSMGLCRHWMLGLRM